MNNKSLSMNNKSLVKSHFLKQLFYGEQQTTTRAMSGESMKLLLFIDLALASILISAN